MPFQITVPVGPAAPMTARNALAEWLSARATIVDALAARWGVEHAGVGRARDCKFGWVTPKR